MSTLTRLSVAFALLGLLLLTFGTAGFSAVSADRGVDVSVVDDSEAYVGIETVGDEAYGDDRVKLLTVTNQFASDMEPLQVSVVDGSDAIEENSVKLEDGSVGVGEDTNVTAECTMQREEGSVDLEITGEAGGASFDITRTIDVDCGPTTGTETVELQDVNTTDDGTGNLSVAFKGFGQVEFSDDAGGTYDVTVHFKNGDSQSTTVDLSDGPETFDRDSGGQIAKVVVDGKTAENSHPSEGA
ncbi:MAG: hypothetical protein V5A46_06835 [Haloferacaceae archaeon]